MGDLPAKVANLALEWNNLHSTIFLLFQRFTNMPLKLASAVFYAAKNDGLKREMTRAAARHVLSEPHKTIAALEKKGGVDALGLFERINGLFEEIDATHRANRNTIIHGSIGIDQWTGVIYINPYDPKAMPIKKGELYDLLLTEESLLEDLLRRADLIFNDCAELLDWQE